MMTENWLVVMSRKEFCFYSLFHHYCQQALQQDMKSFAWCNSVIDSELFIDEQFWQKVRSISLQQWWT